MRNAGRGLLVALVATFLMGQDGCQNPSPVPNYRRPGQSGPTPPNLPELRTWRYSRVAPDGPQHPCGTTYYTFGVVQDGVQCDANFDFTPLVKQAQAESAGLVHMCPPGCTHRYITINSLNNTCERGGTRARARIEVAVTCAANPIVPPPAGYVIPDPVPAGPFRQPVPPAIFPWPVNRAYEADLNWPQPALGCNEEVKVEYRRAAACGGRFNYTNDVQAAVVETIKRHNTLTCAAGCIKQLGPQITFTRWGCSNNNTEVLVEVAFKSCIPGPQ